MERRREGERGREGEGGREGRRIKSLEITQATVQHTHIAIGRDVRTTTHYMFKDNPLHFSSGPPLTWSDL